jgi:hypothetical protein
MMRGLSVIAVREIADTRTRPVLSYTKYENALCKCVLNSGDIIKGYIDKIDETNIVFRKSLCADQTTIRKGLIATALCGADTVLSTGKR